MPADSLFFSFFFDDYDYLKKKKKKPFSCNLASIQNTDYPLYPRWKRSTHTDSYRDAVDGVKKNYPLKLKTSTN